MNKWLEKYQDGGKINPVPNDYLVVRGNKRKVLNGELMNTYVPTSDTLYYQDAGYWGENFRGINVPPPLPTNKEGRVDLKLKKIPPLPETAQKRNGGEFEGLTTKGFDYSPAWGGRWENGGSIPGTVGFTYARTGDIPSNGKYAKKTLPSAENGMTYYQNGLDFKPKMISQDGIRVSPKYVEKLKTFENSPNNLGYHTDSRGIPTIGWGHRIKEDELKRGAIKVGKEWIPYNQFEGKAGRKYADKLLAEYDLPEHYKRMSSKVGESHPTEVLDVLADHVYNAGHLPSKVIHLVNEKNYKGLYDYYSTQAGKLSGGAKTRMQWRADAIRNTPSFGIKLMPFAEPSTRDVTDIPHNVVLPKIEKQGTTLQTGGIVEDNNGYWNPDNWGKPVKINSNNITMQGVNQPLIGISDAGDAQLMRPNKNYKFKGKSVIEIPMARLGVNQQDEKTAEHLDQLTNFTNYNPTQKGWLEKYA